MCSSTKSGVKAVVAGRNRRMSGEDHFAGDARHGGVKRQSLFFHAHANRFQHRKSAMPFVQMQHAGRNPQRLERAQSAYAQQQFLADADAEVATIEARGQFAVLRSIALHVGIEQKKIATAYFYAPYLSLNTAATGFDFDDDRPAIFADRDFHRHLIDVSLEVFFALPAVKVEVLAEVPLSVEKANTDQGNIEVGSALDVIAGEHPQAAGVDGQGFVQAELGGKIGNGMRPQYTGVLGTPGPVRLADIPACRR